MERKLVSFLSLAFLPFLLNACEMVSSVANTSASENAELSASDIAESKRSEILAVRSYSTGSACSHANVQYELHADGNILAHTQVTECDCSGVTSVRNEADAVVAKVSAERIQQFKNFSQDLIADRIEVSTDDVSSCVGGASFFDFVPGEGGRRFIIASNSCGTLLRSGFAVRSSCPAPPAPCNDVDYEPGTIQVLIEKAFLEAQGASVINIRQPSCAGTR